jgi:hypothetical protein
VPWLGYRAIRGKGLEGSRPRVEGYGMKERNRPELLAFLDTDNLYSEHIIVVCRYGRDRLCSRTYDINIFLAYWQPTNALCQAYAFLHRPYIASLHRRLSRSAISAFLSLNTSSTSCQQRDLYGTSGSSGNALCQHSDVADLEAVWISRLRVNSHFYIAHGPTPPGIQSIVPV